MTLAIPDIARLLEYYLAPDEAARRAHAVAEDMGAIGFDVVRSFEVSDAEWRARGVRPQAEYVVPRSPFSIDSANGHQAMEGSGLTRGNLLRLSHAVDLGRTWLPEIWPRGFALQLLGAEHLDTLNEIWWLKFWRSLIAVRRGPKSNPAAPDADWLLEIRDGLADCTVNLEVKRRTGNINAWFKKGKPTVSLEKVAKKFQPTGRETANVVAVTIYHQPLPDELRDVADWLTLQPAIDAVLVWVENNAGGDALLKFVKPDKPWIKFLIKSPDPEDLRVAGLTMGTLCLPEELPAFLRKLAATVRPPNA